MSLLSPLLNGISTNLSRAPKLIPGFGLLAVNGYTLVPEPPANISMRTLYIFFTFLSFLSYCLIILFGMIIAYINKKVKGKIKGYHSDSLNYTLGTPLINATSHKNQA